MAGKIITYNEVKKEDAMRLFQILREIERLRFMSIGAKNSCFAKLGGIKPNSRPLELLKLSHEKPKVREFVGCLLTNIDKLWDLDKIGMKITLRDFRFEKKGEDIKQIEQFIHAEGKIDSTIYLREKKIIKLLKVCKRYLEHLQKIYNQDLFYIVPNAVYNIFKYILWEVEQEKAGLKQKFSILESEADTVLEGLRKAA